MDTEWDDDRILARVETRIGVTDAAGVVHEVKAEHCRKAKKGEG